MRKSYTVIFQSLIGSLLFTGCLDFGEDEQITTPTKDQLSRCRVEMYLKPSMKITPLGYKLEGSGIDDAIWFKFKTDVSDLKEIFDSKIVDTSKFKDGFAFAHDMDGVKWWDTKGKDFLGGQVELRNARFMNVGIEKNDDGYLVYIMWHETSNMEGITMPCIRSLVPRAADDKRYRTLSPFSLTLWKTEAEFF